MKLSSGIDIERIDRFARLLQKEHFCSRIFTPLEREHIASRCDRVRTAAGIYCAKEAIGKALGRGLFGLLPQELGLEWSEKGAPRVVLTGRAREQYGHWQLSVSITHAGEYAAAVCTALDPEE